MPAAALPTAIRPHRKYADSDALAAEITELYACITVATHKFLTLVAEFDEQGYWQLGGVQSCAHWLNWRCGIGMNAAREKVRVARALKALPKVSKAFARGEISFSKVRAISRVATPETEDYLLTFARNGTAHHVEKLVRGYRRASRLQDDARYRPAAERRELTTRWDEDGCLVVTARLPAEQGALLLKAMQLALDRQFEAARETRDEDKGVSYGAEIHATDAEMLDDQIESAASRRANALAEMAEAYLNSEAPTGSSGDRYQVVVHVTAETPDPLSNMPHVDNGPHVTAVTSRRISCDSSVVPLFKNAGGEPLSVGRKTRAIPPSILRALRVRDGGCRFPGCTHTRFVDGHHIRHWADGGDTSLDNLVLLCRHHHGLVHEGGFGCEVNRHGAVVFKSPRGNVIPEAFEMTAPGMVQEPAAMIARHADCSHVTAETCGTRWAGEQCDWDLAVGHLFAEPCGASP